MVPEPQKRLTSIAQEVEVPAPGLTMEQIKKRIDELHDLRNRQLAVRSKADRDSRITERSIKAYQDAALQVMFAPKQQPAAPPAPAPAPAKKPKKKAPTNNVPTPAPATQPRLATVPEPEGMYHQMDNAPQEHDDAIPY